MDLISDNTEMLSFEQWTKRGFKIHKGQKATIVNNVPLFSESQTYIDSSDWVKTSSRFGITGQWDDMPH